MMELRVEHLCKRYGENAVLDDISFTARVGVTRLLGPSGIGKTTLLRVLLGLETPDSGTVNGDKFRWTAVFQENRLLEGLDAEGNLRFHDPENRSLFYFVSCLHERSSSFFRRRIENSDKRSFHYFAF